MAGSNRVRVLLFESAPYVQARLLEFCRADNNMEVVGLFPSLGGVLALRESGAREFLRALAPDVTVFGVAGPLSDATPAIRELMDMLPGKFIAFATDDLDEESAADIGLFCALKRPGIDAPDDKSRYIKLIYLIRSARLTSMVEILSPKKRARQAQPPPARKSDVELIAIGASAGGTNAILRVLRELPRDMPGIVAVQHMPRSFADMFINSLNASCDITVKAAEEGERIERGVAYLASGDTHMAVRRKRGGYFIRLPEGEKVSGHRPSVDVLFSSVAEEAGEEAIGVILTGMGADGAKGLMSMRNAGAHTIGQDRGSSVVYGMPQAAYEMGAVAKQLPIDSVPGELIRLCLSGQAE